VHDELTSLTDPNTRTKTWWYAHFPLTFFRGLCLNLRNAFYYPQEEERSMKTLFSLAVAMLFLASLSANTLAQQRFTDDRKMAGKEITPENFNEMKARVRTMIEDRRTRLDAEKACVDAAKDAEELKKCRPERPMGMGGGMHQNGPGRQRGPRADGSEGQQ